MGLIRGVARTAVIAGTATAVSNRVSRRQAGRWADQEQQQYDQQQQYAEQYHQQQMAQQQYAQQQQQYAQQQYAQQQPAAAAGGDAMQDKLAQLKTLADLKAQGVLTDAEFEQQKAAILAG
ncbi:SHOCT domain-containing protein [Catellatospora sp. IY07-71]|uniref:SHOCT domain-containing protein n=1 Tax=Catellatospora sp. IY07-71 TaxID=2728827 RepID=UPI001BB36CAC|nr:SHOCT domain-containing protein [Catellatospora sp. IY07-71]